MVTDGRRIVITMQHPGDVHFFRVAIDSLVAAGHEVSVFVRANEVTEELLSAYGIDHTVLVGEPSSLPSLAFTQVQYEYRLWRRVRHLDPDVIAGVGGVTASHVATLVGTRSVAFTDTEHATIVNRLAFPFADVVCTPSCFKTDVGPKQLRYPGYQELAYLRPEHFTPDASILEALSVPSDRHLVVLRLSSWDSSHDIGQGGFGDIEQVIEVLESEDAYVALTSEIDLPPRLSGYVRNIPPERMHDVLYHADLYLGEGATMAAESAILGTPAVYVNSLSMGYIEDLDRRYRLLHSFNGPDRHDQGLACARRILRDDSERGWETRRQQMLDDTIDVAEVIAGVLTGVVRTEADLPVASADGPQIARSPVSID